MSTGLRDALQKPIRRRVTIRVPPGHARQLDQYRNKSRVVRDATHAYLTAYADSNTTIQQTDDDLTKCGSSHRLSIRVTQELLDDIHTLIDEGHAPTRSAVIRRAIARYLDGRPR